MSTTDQTAKAAARAARDQRLAAALRRNLRRRKAGPEGDRAGPPGAGAAEQGGDPADRRADAAGRAADLAALLRDAAEAHHAAFAAVDGEDPSWPEWYAAHLLAPERRPAFERALGRAISTGDLAACLERAEEMRQVAPAGAWPEQYARFMIGA